MRRVLASIAFLSALGGIPDFISTASAEVARLEKIAVVDLQRCLLETTQGQKAKKDLERVMARGQAKLERKAADLERQLKDLQAKSAMLSQGELMRRQQELMAKDQELQRLGLELQEDLARKEALLTEKVYKNVSSIVKKMSVAEGIQVVLVRSQATVLYVNPKLDLTNKVIVAYDKKYKK